MNMLRSTVTSCCRVCTLNGDSTASGQLISGALFIILPRSLCLLRIKGSPMNDRNQPVDNFPADTGASAQLLRVGAVFERPESQRPAGVTPDELRAWLLGAARRIESTVEFVDELCWRLVAGGVPLTRVTVSLPTLHPQFLNNGYRWSRATGRCEEMLVGHGIRDSAMFLNSPMHRVFVRGEMVRRHLAGPKARLDFPILEELAQEGATDYIALPVELSDERRFAITLATDREGGFSRLDFATLESLVGLLAPLIEIHVMRGITRNLLNAYLGAQIGQRVLAGEIERGRGEMTRAVIWFCDLRGFTALAERLMEENVVAFLDAYFERVVRAVHARDGEVLKFLGDGLIAIFPVPDIEFAANATRRACEAACMAIAEVDALGGHASLNGEPMPRMCVSLHVGNVFYGNIGAADRLDFTVIGPAVNLVARVDQLTKVVDRRILMTADFAKVCGQKLESLGRHSVRGVAEAIEIFGLMPDADCVVR
jgi:adenylate cyclase